MSSDSEIAVVGIGCRFPDARTPREFWRNIDNGVVSLRELPEARLRAAGIPEDVLRSEDFVRVGTTLPGVEDFAADFFGCSPREAETMDPQHRIFLEACWEALESAGHPSAKDGPVVGVFAGSAVGTYSAALFAAKTREDGLTAAVADLELTVGGQADFLTSKAAYKLGLRGPAVTVQTACSSGLYAAHYATLSLLSGECDIALVGGATVLEPIRGYLHQAGRTQSADGYCRSFDARSSGTNYSSGVGVVALRRLSDALADGDHVLAVLRGSAVGNDGGDRLGFNAPSPAGIAGVAAAALRVADVPGDLLRYVEAHGTATPVGDHIELQALTTALRATTDRIGFCGLGSVMTNIGHTGPAAGIAGLIKAVHIAGTGSLPPHPMFDRARDPGVLAESPFFVPTAAQVCTDPDRHVLVNSIGVGGANAAVVLAAPPGPVRAPAARRETVRLVLSARTRAELDELSRALADELDTGEFPVADVAHTLRAGRRAFDERRVVTARPGGLSAALRLPRPPAAHTVRATSRRALVVLPPDTDVPADLLDGLLAALPGPTEVQRHPAVPASDGRFRILVGHGSPGPDHAVLPVEAGPDTGDLAAMLDAAVTAAWLHGVPVDWDALAAGRGRRVPLPTYPFTRKRYWALDRLSVFDAPAPAGERTARDDPAQTPADSLEDGVLAVWRTLFGVDTIGPDDEFGRLGGTSLSSVQMVLAVQQRYGVLVNVHRAGGSKATVRKIADLVRGMLGDPEHESPDMDRMDHRDDDLLDADLRLPLGPLASTRARGRDVLLTGGTGYLGAFLLHELLNTTPGRIYCVVRAGDEAEGRRRLGAAAAKSDLPEPDPDRVHVVPGDLRGIAEVCERYRDGELADRVGHVLHSAAKVVFTEPYRNLREDNVLPVVELLTWMRRHGIRDYSYVSTVAATGPAMGDDERLLETREQSLDPRGGGYAVSKWVAERLLDKADQDGMRVRVFRPGLIMASSRSGACNDKDLIWLTLASGLAVGAHPLDDRVLAMSPVDMVAKGVVELAMSPGAVGRAYHLTAEKATSLRQLFELLAEAGLPTEPVEPKEWQERVTDQAMARGNPVLATAALLEIEGHELDEDGIQAANWQPWLRRGGLDPALTGDRLRRGLTFLARRNAEIGALLPELAAAATPDEIVETP
jgi:phthiocerol/phenolphthiocerol synthesis type-I polyketide synthase E